MKISEIIIELKKIENKNGDLEIKINTGIFGYKDINNLHVYNGNLNIHPKIIEKK